jgi:phytoene dehydrogenase-like protein
MEKQYDAIVVGAGVAGLGVAGLLAKAGKKVLLAEKKHNVGGRAATFKKDGVVRSIGQHAMLKNLKFDELLKRLEVKGPKRQYFSDKMMVYEGQFKSILEVMPVLAERAAQDTTKILEILKGKVDLEALDDMSAYQWLKSFIPDEALLNMFRVGAAIMTTVPRLEEMSASIAYETMQILFKTMSTWLAADGLQEFLDAMAQKIVERGGTVATGTSVQSVIIENNKATGILIGKSIQEDIEGEFSTVQEVRAPIVILAIPMWDIFAIIPEEKFPPMFVQQVHHLTLRTANLGITALLSKPVYEGKKFYMVDFPSINRPGSMFMPTNVCPHLAPEGQHLFECSVICNYEDLTKDQALKHRMLEGMKKDLQQWFPRWDKDALWISTYFHYEEPRRTPGRAGKYRLGNKAPNIGGLYFAGDSYASRALPGLECASDSAMLCVKEILGSIPQ